MTNWKNIHPNFTEELQKKWETQGFDYHQTKNWLNIGLSPQDSDFANYLKKQGKTPQWYLNHSSIEKLRAEYLQETVNGRNGNSAQEKTSAFNKKEQELSQLVQALKNQLDLDSQDWLETLLEAQAEVVKTNSHFALKQLTKAKNKLVNKLSETELENICQKQIELTQVPTESTTLPFPALSNEEIAGETLKSWFTAIEKNDTGTISDIFQHHPEIINSYDEDGNGALHNAAHAENLATIETLLGLGDQLAVNTPNQEGFTPLHIAVSRRHWEIVNRLLEKKANPNAKSLGGNTPCHFAAGQNDLPLLQLLVKYGGDINAVNKYGWSVLHGTASGIIKKKEDWEIMEWLLSRPGIKTEVKTEDDFTVEDVFLQRDYSYAEQYNELVAKFGLTKINNQVQILK